MNKVKRLITLLTVLSLIITNLALFATPITAANTDKLDELLGVYDGYYTATQGLTGLTLSVYRTKDLLNDNELLQNFANIANSYYSSYGNSSNQYSAEYVKEIVSRHPDEYIAIFNFFPMIDENGNLPNPNVEEGLYTMTVSYNEATGTYTFIGKEWIQHLSYVFVDLENVTLTGDYLSGDVFGYVYVGSNRTNVGSVSAGRNQDHGGFKIVLETNELTVALNDETDIKAIVKDSRGATATSKVPIKWGSKDEDIVEVSGENWGDSGFEYAIGSIIGKSVGTTEIYAELDNKRIAICEVTVTAAAVAPIIPDTPAPDVSATEDSDGSILPYILIPLLLLLLIGLLCSLASKRKKKKKQMTSKSSNYSIGGSSYDFNGFGGYNDINNNNNSNNDFKW